MALVINDRVRETTTVEGTGAALLLGAAQGFQSFAVVGNANTTYYCIADQSGANWEVGIGTYVSATPALARTTVLASSNANALVVFTAGIKDVFVTYPSSKGLWKDASGNVGIGTTTPTNNLTVNGGIDFSGSAFSGSGTGIWQQATNKLGFVTAGSTRCTIDATGNVGIGTTSPAQKLDILSTTTTVAKLTGGTGSNQGSYLSVQGNAIGNYSSLTGGVYNADLMITGSGGSTVWYQSPGAHIWNAGGASEKMRITSTGIALIGTTAASGANLLQVNSDALINNVTVGRGANSVVGNTAVGTGALASASLSGANNSAYGYQALAANTTGAGNTSSGIQNLFSNTTGGSNTSSGFQSLFSNISGSNNTALGSSSLRQNSTGVNSVAVGVNALTALTTTVATLGTVSGGTGYTNGTYTGVQLTLSSGSPVSSAVGTYPIATIVVAGGVVTTVTLTSFGTCLQNTTTVLTCPAASIGGTVTTAWSVPVASLSTGEYNTAIGVGSLSAMRTGIYNIGIGQNAGGSITTGSSNVVIGGYTGSAAPISATGSNYIVLSDGAGAIRTYYDASGNQVNYGVNATSAAAPTIASATTIAPTKAITFISGVTPVVTITAPSPISLGGGTITLIPTGIFTTTIAGNIALASTAVVGRALTMTYDVTTTKWYPSY